MTALTQNDKVAIGQLVVFVFFFFAGIYLCLKHGWGRSAGFLYVVIFSLARIIGDAMLLATLSAPTNTSLFVGWAVLNGIGLTILILVSLGLLTRLFDSLGRTGHPVKPIFQRIIQLLMLVSLVLQIVGGTEANYTITGSGYKINYPAISKAAMGITIFVTVLVILEAFFLFNNQAYIAAGEHRLLWGVIVAFPFIIVRLAYSCLIIFADRTAGVWLNLGMSVIMEMLAVLIYIAVGVMTDKVAKKPEDREMRTQGRGNAPPSERY